MAISLDNIVLYDADLSDAAILAIYQDSIPNPTQYIEDTDLDVPATARLKSWRNQTTEVAALYGDGSLSLDAGITLNTKFHLVAYLGDLPAPVAGVISLEAGHSYFFTQSVDLAGSRLECGDTVTILGTSSENVFITSTGLDTSTALITTTYTLVLRNITLQHDTLFDIDGTDNTVALDWTGVNFRDAPTIGTIQNIDNFVFDKGAFLDSTGLIFDGTANTIAFTNSLFSGPDIATAIITVPATATIARRFRVTYSSFVVPTDATGIDFDTSATVPVEAYILDTVNFSGAGTYLAGFDNTYNETLFIKCVGIENTSVNGQLYMQGNATATTVSATDTFYKVAGTTTASTDNRKYLHTDNRLTNDAVIQRKFRITATISFNSGNNNVCEFGFYDSKLAAVRTPSRLKATANSAGRAESITISCIVNHSQGDYLEIHCANTSASTDITVTELNFIITDVS